MSPDRRVPRAYVHMHRTEYATAKPPDPYAAFVIGLPPEQQSFVRQLLRLGKMPLYAAGSEVIPDFNIRLQTDRKYVTVEEGQFVIRGNNPRVRFGADPTRARRSA